VNIYIYLDGNDEDGGREIERGGTSVAQRWSFGS
jgi:hypothetical protein